MKISLPALLGKIAGGALIVVAPLLALLFPKVNPAIFAAIFGSSGIVVLVTGLIVQSLMPVNKLTDDAEAYNAQGVPVGQNVTTTTLTPIMAPQAPTTVPVTKGP